MLYLTFVIGCWIGCAGGIALAGFRSRPATRNVVHPLSNGFEGMATDGFPE